MTVSLGEQDRVVGLDVHCGCTAVAAIGPRGRVLRQQTVSTAVPDILEALSHVGRPRVVVIEEGPLADWLLRSLAEQGEDVLICDPRRNALVAKESDKDDPIDALKLAQLGRGGFLRRVHHPASFERMIFKRRVALYHDRVRNRVRQANRVMAQARLYGVFMHENAFADAARERELWSRLPDSADVHKDLRILLQGYRAAQRQEAQIGNALLTSARRYPEIKRFQALPGYGQIWSATFFAFVDTPWRFRNKSALWKYLGIGLARRGSGGPVRLGVPVHGNKLLKSAVMSAARTAIRMGNNEFADLYERWLAYGLTPRVACRNVARRQSAVLWGLWKNGGVYRPEWIGRSLQTAAVP
jgi:transposase